MKRLLTLLVCLAFGAGAAAQIGLVDHATASGASGATTSAINTTGATLLVASVSYYANGSLSDSKGNTWTPLTAAAASPDDGHRLYYAVNPTVGTGHTFSTTAAYVTLNVAAFSGVDASSPFDAENVGSVFGGGSQNTGNITPSSNGQLIVTGSINGGGAGTTQSVNNSFIVTDNIGTSVGAYYGGALAYKVQTTAATIDATWTFSGSVYSAGCSIASFKAASGGGGGSSVKTHNGLSISSVKTVNGLSISSVKSKNGLQ